MVETGIHLLIKLGFEKKKKTNTENCFGMTLHHQIPTPPLLKLNHRFPITHFCDKGYAELTGEGDYWVILPRPLCPMRSGAL